MPLDIVKARKHSRSVHLALTIACEELITQDDFSNPMYTRTFTHHEVDHCISNCDSISKLLKDHDSKYWKYLVLILRNKFQGKVRNGLVGEWNLWIADARKLMQ